MMNARLLALEKYFIIAFENKTGTKEQHIKNSRPTGPTGKLETSASDTGRVK